MTTWGMHLLGKSHLAKAFHQGAAGVLGAALDGGVAEGFLTEGGSGEAVQGRAEERQGAGVGSDKGPSLEGACRKVPAAEAQLDFVVLSDRNVLANEEMGTTRCSCTR